MQSPTIKEYQEQLRKLDEKFGKGKGAKKERAKLQSKIEQCKQDKIEIAKMESLQFQQEKNNNKSKETEYIKDQSTTNKKQPMNNMQKIGLFIGLFIGTIMGLWYFNLSSRYNWRQMTSKGYSLTFYISICSYIFSLFWVFLFKDKSSKSNESEIE